jgi:hypothetical protein
MLIAKFAMFFLLLWMAFLLAYLNSAYQRHASPQYYAAASTSLVNAIQPRFRVPYTKMREHPTILAVTLDPRGNIYMIQRLEFGKETGRTYYYRDMHGRLRYEGIPDGWGRVQLRQVSAP